MKRRWRLVAVLFVLWGVALAGRLVVLQVFRHERYAELARRQQERLVPVHGSRGTIFDAAGRVLALSVEAESLFADPGSIEDPPATAQSLAAVLGLDADALAERLRLDRQFVWVARKLDRQQAEAVRRLDLPGLGFLPEPKRHYPMGELAAQVLGFVGTDDVGLAGLEQTYDSTLAGESVDVAVLRDARGEFAALPGGGRNMAERGEDLRLTLDAVIQHFAHRRLERLVAEAGARAGSCVVLEPASGAILALASYPFFDPNRFQQSPLEHWRNRAVTDVAPPGDLLIPLVAAAALEHRVAAPGDLVEMLERRLMAPDDVLDAEMGEFTVEGMTIRDRFPFGRLTVRQVVERSSRVGGAKIGRVLGPSALFRHLDRLGFGHRTGVGLPGEPRGLLRSPEDWSLSTTAAIAVGRGMAATALQTALAYATLANGGRAVRPVLVAGATDGEAGRDAGARVLSASTSFAVLTWLEEGLRLGRPLQLAGYRVTGEIGTVMEGEDGRTREWLSVVVALPSPAARVLCLCTLTAPRQQADREEIAKTVARGLLSDLVKYLRIPPAPVWERLAREEDT